MTWKIKIRSEGRTKTIAAEYECPVHGRFELDVERNDAGDAPDVIECPLGVDAAIIPHDNKESGWALQINLCGQPAEWRISSPLAKVRSVEAVNKGKSEKPEFKTWTDTRNIGEGQPLYEWKEDRAKIWEEKRKQDVVDFAREHNERVIGGD